MPIYLLILSFFVGVFPAYAKTFSNQFIEFKLPEKWKCQLDGTEWVCQNTDEETRRDAIIVLAAKIRKPGMDEMNVYKEHLQKKQKYKAPNGQEIVSEPKYVKEVDIAGKTWIDALHLQSEIPDFYTRYLTTVESDLGVLVTFSVRKDKYEEYAPDIEAMVSSLKVFRKPGAINQDGNQAAVAPSATPIDPGILFPGDNPKNKPKNKANATSSDDMLTGMFVLFVIVGAIGYLVWRRKKS